MIPAGVLLVAFGGLIAVAPYASSRLTEKQEERLTVGLGLLLFGLLVIGGVNAWRAL